MNEKIVICGCHTWYENKNNMDVIEWENDKINVHYDIDYLNEDDYFDEKENVYYTYEEISNSLFHILANVLLNKKIEIVNTKGTSISNISTFIFNKDSTLFELIIDEANLIYFINEIQNFDHPTFPIEIINALINGLKQAGYKKCKIIIEE